MIIISQDKTIIINFNNAEAIEIGNVEENQGKGIIYVRLKSDYFYEIGEYKTEERAKEVLQKIIKFYDNTQIKMMIQSTMMLNSVGSDFVYQMPEE